LSLGELEVKDDVTYEEQLVKILEIAERITKSTRVRPSECAKCNGSTTQRRKPPRKEKMN